MKYQSFTASGCWDTGTRKFCFASKTQFLFFKFFLQKACREKAELSTTIANIIGDAIIPGLFNLLGCVAPFFLFQWYCYTHFCRLTKQTPGSFIHPFYNSFIHSFIYSFIHLFIYQFVHLFIYLFYWADSSHHLIYSFIFKSLLS